MGRVTVTVQGAAVPSGGTRASAALDTHVVKAMKAKTDVKAMKSMQLMKAMKAIKVMKTMQAIKAM